MASQFKNVLLSMSYAYASKNKHTMSTKGSLKNHNSTNETILLTFCFRWVRVSVQLGTVGKKAEDSSLSVEVYRKPPSTSVLTQEFWKNSGESSKNTTYLAFLDVFSTLSLYLILASLAFLLNSFWNSLILTLSPCRKPFSCLWGHQKVC